MFLKHLPMIYSENPDKLVKFYTDVLEMKILNEFKLPDDYGYKLQVSETSELFIGRHSEVKSKNKDPFRHMHTFYTDDVKDWYKKVKDNPEVEIICKPEPTPGTDEKNPRLVCTILDPEGNCLQFLGSKK